MFSNKKAFIVLVLFLSLPLSAFTQSIITSGQTGTAGAAQPGAVPVISGQPQTIADRTRNLTYQFELKPKLIEISAVIGFTMRTSQIMFLTSVQAGIFLNSYLELGLKMGYEYIKTYKNFFEITAFARVYFTKSGETMPFFQLDAGGGLGKKLRGWVVRPGFGMLQHIKDSFNIFLSLSYDVWFFNYRFNEEDVIPYDQFLIKKIHTDFRIAFGLTFFLNR